MAFHEIRFPAALGFGSTGGPERRTEIVTLANGHEERNTPWAHSRRRYDAGMGLRALADVETVLAFFEARRGALHAFRWKDWMDFRSAPAGRPVSFDDQDIAMADGDMARFRLTKRYGSGEHAYIRPIAKPVAGTVLLGVEGDALHEGMDFNLDPTTGWVELPRRPPKGARITAGFEFDVPARFDTDRIDISAATFEAGEIPDIPVIEVRI